MTKHETDILNLYKLCKKYITSQKDIPMIVPLLEEIEDLQNSDYFLNNCCQIKRIKLILKISRLYSGNNAWILRFQ